MTNEETKKLCLDLMRADTEEGVIDLLVDAGFWNDSRSWRHLGDNENNYSTIGNQQSRAEAALVEKLVNSIDARLVNVCYMQGIDPESPGAPSGIQEAVARFYENHGTAIRFNAGRVKEWSNEQRTREGRLITLAATGHAPAAGRASITIADAGEGHSPDQFPNTFCSLNRSNKLKIPFVQGKFNMGGTGALQFCGRRNLQLIVSRRNPLIPGSSSPDSGKWGFTLVRREDPPAGRRSSVYTYLAPVGLNGNDRQGSVLAFVADSMPIFPEIPGDANTRDAYARHSEYGSLVKLYEYFKGSNIIMTSPSLLQQVDLLLPEVALPIRVYECRAGYKGHKGSFETNVTGLAVRLEDDRAENLEKGFPSSAALDVDGQSMDVTIFAFAKNKAKGYRSQQGVVFTINGQAHGHLTVDFFRRKSVGMSGLADSLLVFVDCTRVDPRAREDLFMNSRDRLRKNELEKQIEAALEVLIGRHQGLEELRNRRRREQIAEKFSDIKPLQDILTSIIRDNEALRHILWEGSQIPNPFAPTTVREAPVFKGKPHPSFFRFRNQHYGQKLNRNAPLNQSVRIALETDVENTYFSRDLSRGNRTLEVLTDDGNAVATNWMLNLHNGTATLSVELPADAEVGNCYRYNLSVWDDTLIAPFVNAFDLNVQPAAVKKPSGPRSPRKPPAGDESDGKDRDAPSGLAIPNPTPVREPDWPNQEPPFDKHTALRLTHAGRTNGVDQYDFLFNADNLYLRAEQKRSKTDSDMLERRFAIAMVLIALGILQDEHKFGHRPDEPATTGEHDVDVEDDADVEKIVERCTRAVAPLLLPMIEALGTMSEVDAVSTGEVLGD